MGTVRKLPSGKYEGAVCCRGRRKSKTFASKKDARRWCALAENELERQGRVSQNGRIVIDAASGALSLKFPHSVTEGYPNRTPPPAYWYDIEIISAEGEVTRVLEGKVIIRANTTRDE